MTYTIVNHLIEFSLDGENWYTFFAPPLTEKEIAGWWEQLPGADHRQRTIYRLVKRTAVITDEVLDTDDPDQEYCPDCGAPVRAKRSGVECSSKTCRWWFCY